MRRRLRISALLLGLLLLCGCVVVENGSSVSPLEAYEKTQDQGRKPDLEKIVHRAVETVDQRPDVAAKDRQAAIEKEIIRILQSGDYEENADDSMESMLCKLLWAALENPSGRKTLVWEDVQ